MPTVGAGVREIRNLCNNCTDLRRPQFGNPLRHPPVAIPSKEVPLSSLAYRRQARLALQ